MQNLQNILRRISKKKNKINYRKLELNITEFSYPSTSKNSTIIISKEIIDQIHTILKDKTRKSLKIIDIKEIHKNLQTTNPGEFRLDDRLIRRHNGEIIVVASYNEIYALKLIEKFIYWLNNVDDHTINIAIMAHLKFLALHPFENGNGRVAHILMQFILHQEGFPFLNLDIKSYNEVLSKANSISYWEILHLNNLNEPNKHLESFILLIYKNIEDSIDFHITKHQSFY